MNKLTLKNRSEWRDWLAKNHNKEKNGVLLVFYKMHKNQSTLGYEEAVEEALCFGWIDGIIKKIDDVKYSRKFTPRKDNSFWSNLNKTRADKLIKKGQMTKYGLAKINKAKVSGMWDKDNRPKFNWDVPEELLIALNKNKKAKAFFNQLAPTYQKQFIGWIKTAKRKETKTRRVNESITLLSRSQKLGLK